MSPAEWIMALALVLGIPVCAWAAWMFQQMSVGRYKPRSEDSAAD